MRFAPPNPLRIADRASGMNAPTVRSYNERLVLSLLLQGSGISRLEIGEKTGLSAQTVSVIIRSLEQDGLVSKGEAQRGRVGPPTIPLSLNPEGAFSVGVSFGGSAVEIVLIDFVGQVQHRETHTYPAATAVAGWLAAKIEQQLHALAPAGRNRVAGIGLAVPDEADTGHRAIEVLGMNITDTQADLERRLNLPIFIQNEITAAAGGESLFGVARPLSDFLFFYLGSYLHSRLILNYQIHSGKTDLSRDIGLAQFRAHVTPDLFEGQVADDHQSYATDVSFVKWQQACCHGIIESVASLLNFVNFKSVVISSYAPKPLRQSLLKRLQDELPQMNVIWGKNSIAPKAVGAASLSYHSRFMVQ